jgi:lysozyme
MSALIDMIKRHEGHGPYHGNRFFPYPDEVGKTTIGWGRNLTDTGVREDEAALMLENDVNEAIAGLRRQYPWFDALDPVRQDAIVDMAYNLGLERFAEFHHMIAALIIQKWTAAKAQALDSAWAREVGDKPGERAAEVAEMIETGQYQNG